MDDGADGHLSGLRANGGICPKIDILRLDSGPSAGVAMLMPRPQGNCSA